MRKLKVFTIVLLMLLLSSLMAGCPTRAKKPVPSTPLPGKVTIDNIDPSKAPTVVKDLIEKQKDRESFNLVRDGSSLYAVVTRGKVPFKDLGVKFKDVEKLDLGNGKTQVRVNVIFTVPDIFPGKNKIDKSRGEVDGLRRITPQQRAEIKKKLGERGEFFPVAVAKVNISTLPDVFTNSVLHERDLTQEIDQTPTSPTGPAPGQTPPQSSVTPSAPAQPTNANISVTSPPPGSTVTTPLTVTGKATASTVTMELRDNTDTVIASKTVSVSAPAPAQPGDFNTTLTFPTRTTSVNGTLQVFSKGTDGSKVGTVSVPVTIR